MSQPMSSERISIPIDNPHEFRVVPLSMGSFGIVNEDGEEVGDPPLCYLTAASAEDAIAEMIADDEEDKRLNRNRHEQQPDEAPQPLQCGARLWP